MLGPRHDQMKRICMIQQPIRVIWGNCVVAAGKWWKEKHSLGVIKVIQECVVAANRRMG